MENIRDLKEAVNTVIQIRMQNMGELIANEMKSNLQGAGHVDTGALLESIRSETERDQNKITTTIYADAQNPVNGAYYAEFIEMGTGAAHGRAGGRVGSWRYKDRHGNWHTTDGMDADPFIQPAVDKYIGDFVTEIVNDIAKYARTVNRS